MRRAVFACVVLVAWGASAACNRKPKDDAPCGAVAGRLYALANDDLAKTTIEPATRRAVADQLPAMRDSLAQICTEDKWPAAARNCMANAVDHAAFQACQQQLSDEQRKGLERGVRGERATH